MSKKNQYCKNRITGVLFIATAEILKQDNIVLLSDDEAKKELEKLNAKKTPGPVVETPAKVEVDSDGYPYNPVCHHRSGNKDDKGRWLLKRGWSRKKVEELFAELNGEDNTPEAPVSDEPDLEALANKPLTEMTKGELNVYANSLGIELTPEMDMETAIELVAKAQAAQ